jgi:hypothetical protein
VKPEKDLLRNGVAPGNVWVEIADFILSPNSLFPGVSCKIFFAKFNVFMDLINFNRYKMVKIQIDSN